MHKASLEIRNASHVAIDAPPIPGMWRENASDPAW
jgi:hypothetical protein